MFKVISQIDKNEQCQARTGKMLDAMETPCMILPTIGGSLPFLLPGASYIPKELSAVDINYADMWSSVDIMASSQQSLQDYLNLPSYKLFVTLCDDIMKSSSRNVQSERSVETTHGRKFISVQEYMKGIKSLSPHCFSALSDEVDCALGKKRQRRSVDTTLNWLDECIAQKPTNSFILGVVVGGEDAQLRRHCASQMASKSIDGVLLGGFGGSEDPEKRPALLQMVIQEISPCLPRILSGVGNPVEIIESVSCGVDAFVTAYPFHMTQYGYALIFAFKEGYCNENQEWPSMCPGDGTKLNLRDKRFQLDQKPILVGCGCFSCKNHSRAYINHLLNVHEMLGDILIFTHNLYHYMAFFQTIREEIENGSFKDFQQRFLDKYLLAAKD